MEKEYKQVIVVRSDLKLPKGKMSAQVAHASVEAVLKTLTRSKRKVSEWRRKGSKKVVVKVATLPELLKLKAEAENNNLVCSLITDAGKTVIAPGTITCLAIGPDEEEEIDKVTAKLKMM